MYFAYFNNAKSGDDDMHFTKQDYCCVFYVSYIV